MCVCVCLPGLSQETYFPLCRLYSKVKPVNVTFGMGNVFSTYPILPPPYTLHPPYSLPPPYSLALLSSPGIEKHDKEGRLITCEYDSFYFVTACE